MTTLSGTYNRGQIEIRVNGACLDLDEHERTRMRLLNEAQFIELLQGRLGRSESEVRQLLENYKLSVTRS